MKLPSLVLTGACVVLLSSCVDPYYAGELPNRADGPMVVERQPVLVERRSYVQEQPTVRVERYSSPSYNEPRPYYGDPVPERTYQRTTTRTYEGY